jgi:Ca2+-binding RTX toxin-like protein
MKWRELTLIVIAVGVCTVSAEAAKAATHEPADAKICRKHNEQGSDKGTTVHLGGGRHLYNGGNGNDKIFGGPKNDIISGGRGNDVVHGGGGEDVVCGGVGNDEVFGDKGRDKVFGEEQDDYLEGGADNDYMNGQAGVDWLAGFGKRHGRAVADGRDFLSTAASTATR